MASSRGDGWTGPGWRRPGIVATAEGAYPPEAEAGAEGLYVAVERCPLCNSTRRRLTCAKCVRSGDFVFFDGRDSERVEFAIMGCQCIYYARSEEGHPQRLEILGLF